MIVTNAAVNAYIDRLRVSRNPSPHTLLAYTSDLRDYVDVVTRLSLPGDESSTILAYVNDLMLRSAAARTVRRRVACLRGFYRDLHREKIVGRSPFLNLELQLPRARSLPRGISRKDARMLASAAWAQCRGQRNPNKIPLIAIAILVLICTGLRVGELVQLRSGDVHADNGALHVRGKGQRERFVFLVDPGLRDLMAKLSARRSGLPLFGNGVEQWSTDWVRRALRAFVKEAGIDRHITPHMLRHTCATLLLEDGVDLRFLQRLLGHESISTTAIYAHVGDTGLQRALEGAQLLARLKEAA